MDLPSLVAELQIRGLNQSQIDSALRCLVHVYAVQDQTSVEIGGVLVPDILSAYPLEVVQAGSQIFLERLVSHGVEVYRLRWGWQEAAMLMHRQLWENARPRWEEFVEALDGRYLGFLLPLSDEKAIDISLWKLRKDLKWFSVEVPKHGWKVLHFVEDVTQVAWKLDLAFGFRPFGAEGVEGERVVLHKSAHEALMRKAQVPPEEFRLGIRLWRFFTEYDVEATDFVELMKDCGLTLEEVVAQVNRFFGKDLTSRYRDGQYPPYYVNDGRKKELLAEIRSLLYPMDNWLSRTGNVVQASAPVAAPLTV